MPIKFGCKLPNNWGIEDSGALFVIGTEAEELGFESIWVSEHVFNAGHISKRISDGPYYEPLTTLTYLASMTSTIRLGTSVLVLPYHHPINLAKELATLDVFCGGRLELGIGAGLVEEEFQALGADFSRRGLVTDECIDAMKSLWTQELPNFSGKYHSFTGLAFSPKPAQTPHPPISVGGTTKPAVPRAARVGDWWHPTAMDLDDWQAGVGYLHEKAISAGRAPTDVKLSMNCELNFPALSGTGPNPRTARANLNGTPNDVIHMIEEYRALGLQQLVVVTTSRNPETVAATHRLFAREVIPAFNK